jgi:hypothetical protein
MLALAEDTKIAHEPFNIGSYAYALDGLARHWFTYAPALPRHAALEAFDKVVKRKTGKVFPRREIQRWVPLYRGGRLIVKDPIACVSSEWLANNFELEVVVLVRHPAAFAASLKRLYWEFPFDHLLDQDLLMAEHLQPYRSEMERRPKDVVAQAALLWKCLYSVLFTYVDRNPGWIVKSHEQLSREPVTELKGLYEALNLNWSDAIAGQIASHTQAGNPVRAPEGIVHEITRDSAANATSWKRTLTEHEIGCVQAITQDTASRYYSGEDW